MTAGSMSDALPASEIADDRNGDAEGAEDAGEFDVGEARRQA